MGHVNHIGAIGRHDGMSEREMSAEKYRVQSLGRALDLIELLAHSDREGARLTYLAQGIGLSKAATYAILRTFLAHGYVDLVGEGASRRYRLGMALARLGDLAIANIAFAELALPQLRALTDEVGMTSRIAIMDQGYAVVVGRIDAPGAVRFDAALGRREFPHSSAVGKALLAAMPREHALAILRRTGMPQRTTATLTTLAALRRDLDAIARRGYAIDDEEDTEGVLCIGTCVFDRNGAPAGAISITGLKQRIGDAHIEELASALIGCADRVSQRLGGPSVREAWRNRIER